MNSDCNSSYFRAFVLNGTVSCFKTGILRIWSGFDWQVIDSDSENITKLFHQLIQASWIFFIHPRFADCQISPHHKFILVISLSKPASITRWHSAVVYAPTDSFGFLASRSMIRNSWDSLRFFRIPSPALLSRIGFRIRKRYTIRKGFSLHAWATVRTPSAPMLSSSLVWFWFHLGLSPEYPWAFKHQAPHG